MIEIRNKQDCCGCTVCASVCPQHCITMVEDSEGFQYPLVDKGKCINCHICEKKCPVIDREKTVATPELDKTEINHRALEVAENLPEASVCFLKDEKLRQQSTSGGFFTALAQHVFSLGGVVCGVILDEKQKVIHDFVENEVALEKMRRSKYVQSNQVGIYQKVKKELESNRTVLYSGTPCQVVGLQSFLGHTYENLITVDVFCHGVGSPLYWEKYVQYISQKMNSPVKEVHFREKTYGYNSACLAVYFQNGKSVHKGHDDDWYWIAFSKNYIYRPSCYACAFKTINHSTDFTIGDFWNTRGLPEKFKDANGCSLVLCHSKKAQQLMDSVHSSLEITNIELEDALNVNGGHQASMLVTSPSVPVSREKFFDDIKRGANPEELCKAYLPISIKQKLNITLKPILYRMGVLEIVKKIKRKNK